MKIQDLHTAATIVETTKENVAVAKRPLQKNISFRCGNSTVVLLKDIGIGERFGIDTIIEGSAVVQFGSPFGTSTGTKSGERISNPNNSRYGQRANYLYKFFS